MCRGGERSGGVEKYRTVEGKDLKDGRRNGREGNLAPEVRSNKLRATAATHLLSPEMHLTDRKYLVGEDGM
jgi:hypothetical protein